MKRAIVVLAIVACDASPSAPMTDAHSSSIAVSRDGGTVYVVNADADSVSIVDVTRRQVRDEVMLGASHPSVDASGAYTPAIMPRALALSPDQGTLYVTGQRSGALYAIDLARREVRSARVCSEPIGVLGAADGATIYVACAQDDAVVAIDAASLEERARVAVPSEPWALAWSPADGALIASHLLGARVTAIDPDAMTVRASWAIPEQAPRGDQRLAHGPARGLYDVASRPGTDELWIAHVMLGVDTAQPELDFESTVFPSLSIVHAGSGAFRATLSTDAPDVVGADGSFGDVVSGPHALTFTRDGAFALVVDTSSEDVLAVDARKDVEAALLRPLPGHMAEGLALSPDEQWAYVDLRNSASVAIVRVDRSDDRIALSVDGPAIPRLSDDPMPAELRLGQHLFYSANSDEYPVTTNHWVACASCHLEGRSDAVTWRFEQGPRDTPTNAGGMRDTGFLFRTADRTRVQDYWRTINVEQGGRFDAVAQVALLDPLAAYVDLGIPAPVPPTVDRERAARGKAIFDSPEVGCAGCHLGPRFTDSGLGNPTLDLAGPIRLHDVGTCVTGGFPDVAHADVAGGARQACEFDTPSLTGVASTPPYLHDGSAATLREVLEKTRGTMGDTTMLSSDQLDDLVEYLRSL